MARGKMEKDIQTRTVAGNICCRVLSSSSGTLAFVCVVEQNPWEPWNGLRVTVASLGSTVFPSPGLAQWLSLNSWLSFSPQSLALPLPPLATLGISQEVSTMGLLLLEEDKNSLGLQTGRGWGGVGIACHSFGDPIFLEGNSDSVLCLE